MKLRLILLLAAAVCISAGSASAADVDFGIQVDWNKFDGADEGDWGLGARLEAGGGLRFITSFDYYFVDAGDLIEDDEIDEDSFDLRFWEVNGNLAFKIPAGAVHPYFGGGVSISRRTFDLDGPNDDIGDIFDDSQTELGFNVFGGLHFGDDAPVEPFIEARGVFYSGDETFADRFLITGGLLF